MWFRSSKQSAVFWKVTPAKNRYRTSSTPFVLVNLFEPDLMLKGSPHSLPFGKVQTLPKQRLHLHKSGTNEPVSQEVESQCERASNACSSRRGMCVVQMNRYTKGWNHNVNARAARAAAGEACAAARLSTRSIGRCSVFRRRPCRLALSAVSSRPIGR